MSIEPDEEMVECVECGFSLKNCMCNIEDELFPNDEDVEDEF